ncbi:gluconate 2-dehydrogenase subunit 3 family protein [Lutimonas halocynthiae]|uniref:gluconate 2-dehydrogenase subunit 3 family protein n=1 Tax=Lutimonas halocynthiae TaxID=1446477 RepID=UPI0025B3027E|nr:gluconate 2-dehydrogenase subunit 3 family protein [Lutimonas halocynthiae]MDN3642974.1 gluconate 2-dehydrogenase subunit 3 family protein [Lutimonas halocynthiae]
MNRRKAIGGILGLAGVSYASVIGVSHFKENSTESRGKLAAHANFLAELVDVIIPATSTPGAKMAGVQDYIINYMEDCSSSKEYTNFLNGLNDLHERCENAYGCNFEDCSASQKNELLENLDNSWYSKGLLMKINNKLLGRSFFNLLKTLTIEGYCTSFMGATKHLEYLPIPGRYKAITSLQTNQKSWATK